MFKMAVFALQNFPIGLSKLSVRTFASYLGKKVLKRCKFLIDDVAYLIYKIANSALLVSLRCFIGFFNILFNT